MNNAIIQLERIDDPAQVRLLILSLGCGLMQQFDARPKDKHRTAITGNDEWFYSITLGPNGFARAFRCPAHHGLEAAVAALAHAENVKPEDKWTVTVTDDAAISAAN